MSVMSRFIRKGGKFATVLRPTGTKDIYGRYSAYTRIYTGALPYKEQKIVYLGNNQSFVSYYQFIVDVELFKDDYIIEGKSLLIVPDETFRQIKHIQPIDSIRNIASPIEWECFV